MSDANTSTLFHDANEVLACTPDTLAKPSPGLIRFAINLPQLEQQGPEAWGEHSVAVIAAIQRLKTDPLFAQGEFWRAIAYLALRMSERRTEPEIRIESGSVPSESGALQLLKLSVVGPDGQTTWFEKWLDMEDTALLCIRLLEEAQKNCAGLWATAESIGIAARTADAVTALKQAAQSFGSDKAE